MNDEEKSCILAEEYFYHVTRLSKRESIEDTGLDPAQWTEDTYLPWFKTPVVFLCTSAAVDKVKKMFDTGLKKQDRCVMFRIPASEVVQHECDVDYSFPARTKGLNLVQCLEKVGCLACYELIPPGSLEVTEHRNENGNWEPGE